jgi:murein DD-endopeptidase MepM/ murein hydrolase activator NlpD
VLLAQELERTRSLLAEVTDTIEAINRRDQQVRLLAGLELTDPDVQLAGIGGPVGAGTERERILTETEMGRDALRMRTDLGSLIRRANLMAQSFDDARLTLEDHYDRLLRTPSTWPTRGWYTSRFSRSRMHPIHGEERPHKGIDIAAPMGTPILAPAKGRVKEIRTSKGYGLMVVVDHGRGVVTRYAHCSKVLVEVGQPLHRGDELALVGKTGIATAPHLHYEVIVNGRAKDPYAYILEEENEIVD